MKWLILSLSVATLTFGSEQQRRAAPLTCFDCPKVADSVDCTTTKLCAADEQCFTDKFISEEGNVFFNLGCKSKMVCDILSSLGKRDLAQVLGEREKRSIIHLCTQCCANGLCNNKLCTSVTTVKPSARCYHCDAEENPESCVDLQTCEPHEECIAEYVYLANGQKRHRMGCASKRLCEAALHHGAGLPHGKRQSNNVLCLGCCSDREGCNHQGCYSIHHINTTDSHHH